MQQQEILEFLDTGNYQILQGKIQNIQENLGKKERKEAIDVLNNTLLNYAFIHNDTRPVDLFQTQSPDDLQEILDACARQFILTKDPRWYNVTLKMSSRFIRKNHQSAFFSGFIRNLIHEGTEKNDPTYIKTGLNLLQQVSFRKYRADLLVEILPQIIVSGTQRKDIESLKEYSSYLSEVNDTSKESEILGSIARGIFTIGLAEGNLAIILESLKIGSGIPQKVRRNLCIQDIFERLADSPQAGHIEKILPLIGSVTGIPEEIRKELFHAAMSRYISYEPDRTKLETYIRNYGRTDPTIVPCIIISLLENAEKSGDRWYYDFALELTGSWRTTDPGIIKQYFIAGVKIAETYRDPASIEKLIPLVSQSKYQSRIFLLFSKSLLKLNEFDKAITLFSSIGEKENFTPQMADCAKEITKYAILHEKTEEILTRNFLPAEISVRDSIIRHSVIEICKEKPFISDFQHYDSLSRTARMHSQPGALLYEAISLLIDYGFLEQNDPKILINITQSLPSQNERELAISSIIEKIGDTGIKKRNRDYLQRAVGLSCLIEDTQIRSRALRNIIDNASRLAAEQGDLNLLQRMKDWSISLLDPTSADFAITNIINGMIQYGLTFKSLRALEEAYLATGDIHDSTIRQVKRENIAEYFVKAGCLLLQDENLYKDTIGSALSTFSRPLEILSDISKQSRILKISSYVDIILTEFTSHKRDPVFIIPLSYYILTIEDPMERDAMVWRVISQIVDENQVPDSSDPYVILIRQIQSDAYWSKLPESLEICTNLMNYVSDPFSRITGVCAIAEEYLSTDHLEKAAALLKSVLDTTDRILQQDEKSFVQIEIARISFGYIPDLSQKSLEQALRSYAEIQKPFQKSPVAEKIVKVLLKISSAHKESQYLDQIREIVADIQDPVAYAHVLFSIVELPDLDLSTRTNLLLKIQETIKSIDSPYDRSLLLLELVSQRENIHDQNFLKEIFQDFRNCLESIKIPYISQYLVQQMTLQTKRLADKETEPEYRNLARKLAADLDRNSERNDPKNETGRKIFRDSEDIENIFSRGRSSRQTISSLEHTINQSQDRGERAAGFGELAIRFHETGQKAQFQKFLQLAKNEATIVRPLSRRAYLLCDLSLRLYAVGEEKLGKTFFDQALHAATNIRQYSLRDEVFEDLGMAMNILQEISP